MSSTTPNNFKVEAVSNVGRSDVVSLIDKYAGVGDDLRTMDPVAIGTESMNSTMRIRIGDRAGHLEGYSNNRNTIAVGNKSGESSQGVYSVAIGDSAGQNNQDRFCVAVGTSAGYSSQGGSSVAVGKSAGESSQGNYSVAVGNQAGKSNQGNSSVAIGVIAGVSSQGNYSIAIGNLTGRTQQGAHSVAIGNNAAVINQGEYSFAVGVDAGQTSQGNECVAIGTRAGRTSQGVGTNVVETDPDTGEPVYEMVGFSVAIGDNAGQDNQGDYSVAIGNDAGLSNQGPTSIIINASRYPQDCTTAGSIVLNADTTAGDDELYTSPIDPSNEGFYVRPIRPHTYDPSTTHRVLFYDPNSHEIMYSDGTVIFTTTAPS